MNDVQSAAHVHVTGIVQGVGFRPFIFGLAERLHLYGWVQNTAAGVDIEIEGSQQEVQSFLDALWEEAPPLAHIDDIDVQPHDPTGFGTFEIIQSRGTEGEYQPVSPDVSICEDCLRELFNPTDRRYRYPFINCTNCGPRFTIIKDIPYDRPNTTMAPFTMCADCAAEYHDPHNRRFHAQPVACPNCGPFVWLELSGVDQPEEFPRAEEAIQAARKLLAEGKILAIKGLGGFHLACDAINPEAVAELRRRKLRVDKAFAVMFPSLKELEANCLVGAVSRKLLESHERPIVILDRRSGSLVAPEIAPGQDTIGAMLPYTPLHYLLLEPASWFPSALVMTSGNLSEEPIAIDNDEARERLTSLVDGFLFHNRAIETRCDDSVVRVIHNGMYPIRRSRGYAPFPIRLAWQLPQILATGAELKNTFCLTRDRYAFLSHHIGDLENYETFQAFEKGIQHYQRLFRVQPELIAYDLHPDYLSTRYALERAERENLPAVGVQHHHAHIAACMAEHHAPPGEQVIGVSFDGTGYGEDGAIWGGEFLLASLASFQRASHLNYVRLPGGDKAIKEPWRVALSWLDAAGLEWEDDLPPVKWAQTLVQQLPQPMSPLDAVRQQINSGVNAPYTSSLGRLFDAVASLIGLRQVVNYEAQAAIELEASLAQHEFGLYAFEIQPEVFDFTPVLRSIVDDMRNGVHPTQIAARFHNTLALAVHEICRELRSTHGIQRVVLSGGVWQNKTLLNRAYNMLKNDDFEVCVHQQVPANDGGLALGQAVIAYHRLQSG
jgi:hydrogenase maturation protein HypF